MQKLKNGVLVDLTADEITARNAEQVTAPTALELSLSEIREKRNLLLKDTDYLALSDQTLTSDMTTYRQSLRDITNGLDTVEKCNNVTWPTKP
tara:strand:+ start:326 stop:604 length:279 start_codon:yes stop_codon:yes gene_type:complete